MLGVPNRSYASNHETFYQHGNSFFKEGKLSHGNHFMTYVNESSIPDGSMIIVHNSDHRQVDSYIYNKNLHSRVTTISPHANQTAISSEKRKQLAAAVALAAITCIFMTTVAMALQAKFPFQQKDPNK